MNADDSSLFELLEPPRGGVEKLRRRLEEGYPRPAPVYRLSAFSLGALALLVAALYYLPVQRQPDIAGGQAMIESPEFDRLLGREARMLPIRVEIDEMPVEAEPVESTDPRVRIYQLL